MVEFDLIKTSGNPIHTQDFRLRAQPWHIHLIIMAKDKKKNADTKKAKKVPLYLTLCYYFACPSI
jgi:hypothetical protein